MKRDTSYEDQLDEKYRRKGDKKKPKMKVSGKKVLELKNIIENKPKRNG